MIILKTKEQISQIKKNGKLLREAALRAIELSKPGVSTLELDKAIGKYITKNQAQATFLGYGSSPRGPFPANSCQSINDVVVHGIPSAKTRLKDGDIISIDIGVTKNGCIADSCFSYGIGSVSEENQYLLNASLEIMNAGISICGPDVRIFEIARAVTEKAKSFGLLTFPQLMAHGTGINLHEYPSIPLSYPVLENLPNIKLQPGMVITVEPVVGYLSSFGRFIQDEDGWTLRTIDRSNTAQFEHSIVILSDGIEILTGTFPEQLIY